MTPNDSSKPSSDSDVLATRADRLATVPQYLVPQRLLSRLMHRLTRIRWRPWKDWQIRWFVRRYGVDMSCAEWTDPCRHADFNSFFTRALRPDARPITEEKDAIACPVDGAVSQLGDIQTGRIFQAKGQDYGLLELLGGSAERAAPFLDGRFATLYLCPTDYHRIHMPLTGQLREMVYVPGRLFSVNTRTARVVPGLFARNERVVTIFDTAAGPMALVLVGAFFVASMETVWAGAVTPRAGRSIETWRYGEDERPSVLLERGQEMGRFNMGSTVIVLFGANTMDWEPGMQAETPVRMGQSIGKIIPPQD